MVKNGEFYMIHEMKKRGMSITRIAEEMGRDRKTIRKWLNKKGPEPYQRKVIRPGKLDPFKDYVRRRMEEGCLNARVILEEIKAKGYTGGITTLRVFEYFGGCTEVMLYDNMKTVVKHRDEQGHPVWNERFSRFASHHGFLLTSCRPYRARTKGKVENGIGYVRKNFWPRVREFTGLDDLNRQAREWLNQVANVRIHGTTHIRPVDRCQEERLKPINPTPFAVVDRHARKVSADCLVSFEANRYSVPFRFMGQIVYVQDDKNGRIRIYNGDTLIAEHPKAVQKG